MEITINDRDPEILWNRYSEYIGEDIYSLETVAGSTIMTRSNFIRLMNFLLSDGKKTSELKLLSALQQIIDANPEPTLPHTTKIRDIALNAIIEHKK